LILCKVSPVYMQEGVWWRHGVAPFILNLETQR